MASSFPQQSRIRKLSYFGLIVVLFSASLLLRTNVVEPTAERLELREKNLGEVELTGETLRLLLTGSRGIVVCALWVVADDKKTRHEWNDLERAVNQLIKLQPHFIEPWLFQSWNLAYNVSVEADHVRDKYFYVSRGIELLSEGERRNRGNPDLRANIGWYYQNKLGQSDEQNYFRCLFQMSCIDPKLRDAKRMQHRVQGRLEVDLPKFEAFCKAQPFLVRRLNEKLDYTQPYQIVEFLKENRQVPSLYQETTDILSDTTPKKPLGQRFPVMPPSSTFRPDELTFKSTDKMEAYSFDNFLAARAWMTYSQDPVEEKDPKLHRIPRRPALKIFQGYPARAQTYYAERLEENGWFDETGWKAPDWFGRPVVLGAEHNRTWAEDEWRKAFEMYQDHGINHGLYKTPEDISRMTESERRDYEIDLRMTNFDHFYYRAQVERDRATVKARKLFYQANRLRGEPRNAVPLYRDPAAFGPPESWSSAAPAGWKRILLDHPEFRRDQLIQEESYEMQMKYLALEKRLDDGLNEQFKWLVVWQNCQPVGAWPNTVSLLLPAGILARDFAVPFRGPLDGVDANGLPIINSSAKEAVNSRRRGPTRPSSAAPAGAEGAQKNPRPNPRSRP